MPGSVTDPCCYATPLQVRRLLGYLSKWLDKYSAELGQELHSVQLPQQLMFPMEEQVGGWGCWGGRGGC
jgi:hypothetical protein